MDKNQIIGLVLIGAIIIGFMLINKPSKDEIAEKNRLDSIALVEKQLLEQQNAEEFEKINESNLLQGDTSLIDLTEKILSNDKLGVTDSLLLDSLNNKLESMYGGFKDAVLGEDTFFTIENDLMEVKILNHGGRIYSVRLKDFVTHDSLPLLLFDGDNNIFKLDFFAENKLISTDNFYFEEFTENQGNEPSKNEIKLRLYAGSDKYLEYSYKLEQGSYQMQYDITFENLSELIGKSSNFIDLTWETEIPFLERGDKMENQNTTLFYKYESDDVEKLSERKSDNEKLSTNVKWIAYKQQFFSSILIAETSFENATVNQENNEGKDGILKKMSSTIALPYKGQKTEIIPLQFYFGPNQYKILKNIKIDEETQLSLQEIIPLGNSVIKWANAYLLIPLFNFLGKYFVNIGLLILIMTLIIKTLLFPLTYKSYLSSAKMRVLKPQIDEINSKIPADKAVERQQSTMALYKKAGVNPMGGCLPVLLQFPILVAMFRFFPASIELRQKSFLWATDLSSYDSIFSWDATIPLISNIYGNHISLFTLLMAAAIVVSTILNGAQMQSGNSSQMASMKLMMYLMPVMMVFWFNNYSSALSYYYLLSNIITIIQTLVMRKFVNEDDLLHKLNTNVKKHKEPQKSSFQKRLEDAAKKRGINPPKK